MTELFRFIEQAFALPSPTHAIDVRSESGFQTSLRDAVSRNEPPNGIRSIANGFLNKHFPTADSRPFALAKELVSFSKELVAVASPTQDAVNHLVGTLF